MKYFEKQRIKERLLLLDHPPTPWPVGYIESKKDHINCLEWLLASYEGRAGSPKELLEKLIDLDVTAYNFESNFIWIKILYKWVYYKKFVGF